MRLKNDTDTADVQLVHQDAVMVLATSITTATGVVTVLSCRHKHKNVFGSVDRTKRNRAPLAMPALGTTRVQLLT